MTEPRRGPGRPRKQAEPTYTVVKTEPAPPGPHILDVRIDGKIKFSQRVYAYTIDQQDTQAVITGALRPNP
jgi:hypothetical protein